MEGSVARRFAWGDPPPLAAPLADDGRALRDGAHPLRADALIPGLAPTRVSAFGG